MRLDDKGAAAFLPDGFSAVRAKDPSKPFRFASPDADGQMVSSEDARFAGKPMIVTFSGTWCPNCNDEAPVLEALRARYGSRGLEVVALHFEYTDDVARSRRLLKSFAARYGVTYPILLAGTTKDAKTSGVSLQLEGTRPYPTTLFLDRTHRVVKTHVGFDGPATGERFTKLKKEMEETVESLLR
jgi:thiol-disulfide isomerase/thioredoxin